jgi:hypothetical protein
VFFGRALALGQIVRYPNVAMLVAQAHLTNCQIERKHRAVLAPPDYFAPNADDLILLIVRCRQQ